MKVENPEPPGRAFTNKELNRIFAQPLFTGCAGENVEAGLFKPGPIKIRDDRFWIPLVLLFTGARSSEAVGLLASEVEIDHAIPHFVIQPNNIRGLKNPYSKRLVPIHPKLIELGFLAFVKARQKDLSNPQLFPMAIQTAYRDGATDAQVAGRFRIASSCGSSTGTILDHADARQDRGSVKCFRNSFEQESLSKLDSDELRQRLTGRKVVSSGRIYTSNQPNDPDQRLELLTRLKREIDKIKDLLGRAYEYFISEFAGAEGKRGGEFFTPQSVVKTLVAMLEPTKGRVYDPCCGSGGMFVQSEIFVEEHQGKRSDIAIYGQERNHTTWRLCKMNLAVRGIDADIKWNNEGSLASRNSSFPSWPRSTTRSS